MTASSGAIAGGRLGGCPPGWGLGAGRAWDGILDDATWRAADPARSSPARAFIRPFVRPSFSLAHPPALSNRVSVFATLKIDSRPPRDAYWAFPAGGTAPSPSTPRSNTLVLH